MRLMVDVVNDFVVNLKLMGFVLLVDFDGININIKLENIYYLWENR